MKTKNFKELKIDESFYVFLGYTQIDYLRELN